MPKLSHEWANKIKDLLARNHLSLRDAEKYTNNTVTRSYLSDWKSGKVPEYNTALKFLSYFSEEEKNECLRAAGYDLQEEEQLKKHPGDNDDRLNHEWAHAIRNLTDQHGISLREAMEFSGAAVSKSAIVKWRKGYVPKYNLAISFLNQFPLSERIECLRAAGYPPPLEWLEEQNTIETEEAIKSMIEDFRKLILEVEIDDDVREQIMDKLSAAVSRLKEKIRR